MEKCTLRRGCPESFCKVQAFSTYHAILILHSLHSLLQTFSNTFNSKSQMLLLRCRKSYYYGLRSLGKCDGTFTKETPFALCCSA